MKGLMDRKFANGIMAPEVQTQVLGCKVNFADTRLIAESVKLCGRFPVEIIGTCCVTAEGERQSRKEVRRALRRVGPGGKVFVTGCAARLDAGSFSGLGENVDVVVGKPAEVAEKITMRLGGTADATMPKKKHIGDRFRTRFFLKVQDGCSRSCSYCVIPAVRGRPVSIPADRVLEEARIQVASGYPELVLTGINIGAYRHGDVDIAGLLEMLAAIRGLQRLRLSSIEVAHLNEPLVEVIRENPIIGRHLHIPLQSGDDGVLESMRRRYRLHDFREKADMIRAAVPAVNLTTDAIVGFPTENRRAFDNTMAFVSALGFSRVHVFTYSARPGTEANRFGDPVPAAEKKERSRLLRELSGRLGREHRQRKVGQTEEVLLESSIGGNRFTGYSSDYTRYVVAGGSEKALVATMAVGVKSESVEGKAIYNVPGKPGQVMAQMNESRGFGEMQ